MNTSALQLLQCNYQGIPVESARKRPGAKQEEQHPDKTGPADTSDSQPDTSSASFIRRRFAVGFGTSAFDCD
ncbi:interferon regulatory factor 4-like protein [Labeo rohita]|uniref:Interferon regulatory factor 4-like protein n=1 Tax=Labeo rohita TaxID=84645 RepID=A0A498NDE7_LABRO|nr:interferon regulatory factor 4-like protein [Labeo rohita]